MQNFKIGEKVVCVYDDNSSKKLIKGETYIIRDLAEFRERKYVMLENITTQFYASRFTNIKEQRKKKLDKLNLYESRR